MRSHLGVSAVLLLATLAAPPAVSAQDVTYKTRSSMSMGGAMDRLMGLAARMGGGSTETIETQYIKPGRMRTDAAGSSSIVDLERRRYLSLDHNNRTYTEVSFDSIAAMAAAMSQQMRRAGQAPRPEPTPSGEPQMEYSFNVAVDPTGERETISGYRAERVFVTVEMEGRQAATADQGEAGGRVVMLTDMWVSRDVPGHEALRGVQAEQAEAMAGAARDMGTAMAAAFAQNPSQRAAMERAAEEMKKVEGMALRTTTHMVMVPLDQEFDRDAALAPPEEKEQGGGVSAGNAARSMLGGLFGGRNQPPPEPEPEPAAEPTQMTIMKVEQEVIEVSTAPIADSMFAVPQGYTLVRPGA